MRRLLLPLIVLFASVSFASQARAQVPFFNQRAALFDPEISVLTTGVLNDVQATVSADRKYVTLNMRSSNSELVALRQFAFQTGPIANAPTGFAGDPAPALAPPPRGNGGGRPAGGDAAATPPAVPTVSPSVLRREGMTLVGRAPSASPSAATGAP